MELTVTVREKHYIEFHDYSDKPVFDFGHTQHDYFERRCIEVSDEDLKNSKFAERFFNERTLEFIVYDQYEVEVNGEVLLGEQRNEKMYLIGAEYTLEQLKNEHPNATCGGSPLIPRMEESGINLAVRLYATGSFEILLNGYFVYNP